MDLNFGVTSIVTLCIVISDGIIICFVVRNTRDRQSCGAVTDKELAGTR